MSVIPFPIRNGALDVPRYIEQITSEEDMDVTAFREQVVRPALQAVSLWSPSAENLIVGTAMCETGLNTLKQDGGPALGICQVEPATYADCQRYLNAPKNSDLKARILSACYLDIFPLADALVWNLRLCVLIARIKYYMSPAPLPTAGNASAMAQYYLAVYGPGKGTYERSYPIFIQACK